MKRLFITLLLMPVLMATAQTVSGTVTDSLTGETLIGATVLDDGSGKGTVTNAYGRYSLTLKGDSATLRISYIGYRPQEHRIAIGGNCQLSVRLQPALELHEVRVTADRVSSPKVSQMSAIEVPAEQIRLVPVIFGESDVLKAIQLLPCYRNLKISYSKGNIVPIGGKASNLIYRIQLSRPVSQIILAV